MKFSDFDLSILGEIGNMSVGGAAASLSDFVNKVVTISIPDIKILTFSELKKQFEPSVVFTRIDYSDGLNGSNILMLKKEEAVELSGIIVKEKLNFDIHEWNDFSQNVITEVFNIMAGNMSSSMSEMFNRKVAIKPPETYEVESSKLDFFSEKEMLITIQFTLKIEHIFKVKLVKIITEKQAQDMIKLIKGDLNL